MPDDPLVEKVPERSAESMLAALRMRVARELEGYRQSGQFSDREWRLMKELFAGMSASSFARAEGISRQGVDYYINRLEARAPLFRRFWRRKNLMRARR